MVKDFILYIALAATPISEPFVLKVPMERQACFAAESSYRKYIESQISKNVAAQTVYCYSDAWSLKESNAAAAASASSAASTYKQEVNRAAKRNKYAPPY
jgi:hypothetical protein